MMSGIDYESTCRSVVCAKIIANLNNIDIAQRNIIAKDVRDGGYAMERGVVFNSQNEIAEAGP